MGTHVFNWSRVAITPERNSRNKSTMRRRRRRTTTTREGKNDCTRNNLQRRSIKVRPLQPSINEIPSKVPTSYSRHASSRAALSAPEVNSAEAEHRLESSYAEVLNAVNRTRRRTEDQEQDVKAACANRRKTPDASSLNAGRSSHRALLRLTPGKAKTVPSSSSTSVSEEEICSRL